MRDTVRKSHALKRHPLASLSKRGAWAAVIVAALSLGGLGDSLAEGDEISKPSAPRWSELSEHLGQPSETKALYSHTLSLPEWVNAEAEIGEEVHCLALNIYFEARSEPDDGKRAVAHVVVNRVLDPVYPATVCDVVRQGGEQVRHRCQFSWWCDGQSDRPRNRTVWQESIDLAKAVYWGNTADPTGGALWYHADYVQPTWSRALKRGPKIGRHIFYGKPEDRTQVASRPLFP